MERSLIKQSIVQASLAGCLDVAEMLNITFLAPSLCVDESADCFARANKNNASALGFLIIKN